MANFNHRLAALSVCLLFGLTSLAVIAKHVWKSNSALLSIGMNPHNRIGLLVWHQGGERIEIDFIEYIDANSISGNRDEYVYRLVQHQLAYNWVGWRVWMTTGSEADSYGHTYSYIERSTYLRIPLILIAIILSIAITMIVWIWRFRQRGNGRGFEPVSPKS
jgi:hypothetical protein